MKTAIAYDFIGLTVWYTGQSSERRHWYTRNISISHDCCCLSEKYQPIEFINFFCVLCCSKWNQKQISFDFSKWGGKSVHIDGVFFPIAFTYAHTHNTFTLNCQYMSTFFMHFPKFYLFLRSQNMHFPISVVPHGLPNAHTEHLCNNLNMFCANFRYLFDWFCNWFWWRFLYDIIRCCLTNCIQRKHYLVRNGIFILQIQKTHINIAKCIAYWTCSICL